MNASSYVIPAPPQPTLPVVGEAGTYPVRRIWCVGRNYLEHIREMGNDERAPPFFFGKQGASEAEIVEAAKAACAHDFIMGFPLGYDTPVGEHGTQLSGGQRQRIAVARALIKNAPIILLDEATAALDSESEKAVQEAIEHLCQNRTTIVIAHRLHTIMHADAILVVEGGEIVERGLHDDLLRRGGRYASFFRLQQRGSGTPSLAPVSATA